LLENLLEWSRVQNGSLVIEPEILRVNPAVADCIVLLAESVKTKTLNVVVDIPAELTVFADPRMFHSVIRNLFSNAVKFSLKGGDIFITAGRAENNNIRISVKDSGIGMNQFILDNLFRIDVQTSRKGTEGESSSGLGLLLCIEFVRKLGGHISVSSRENEGSEFVVVLPENRSD
jgi:signal transduction histidine kinase